MIDPTSRYASLAQAPLTWVDAQGRETRYVPRRLLVPVEVFELLAEVTVQGGDRLDLIAARTLGSADAWWRIADANETLDPAALTSPPPPAAGGATAPLPAPRLRIPVPRA